MRNFNSKKLALNLINSIHGSGIDCNYDLIETKKSIRLKNSFHCMDEWGGYDGYLDFSVLIDKKQSEVKKIIFHNHNSYNVRKYGPLLKDYLEDLFIDPMIYKYEKTPYYLN